MHLNTAKLFWASILPVAVLDLMYKMREVDWILTTFLEFCKNPRLCGLFLFAHHIQTLGANYYRGSKVNRERTIEHNKHRIKHFFY